MEILKYLTVQNGSTQYLEAGDLIYLGSRGESEKRIDQALHCYQLVEKIYPDSSDLEMAWYRKAAIAWRHQSNPQNALAQINSLLAKFPSGRMMFEAEDMRTDLMRELSNAA